MRQLPILIALLFCSILNAQLWELQGELLPTQSYPNENFGSDTAVDNDIILVSTPDHNLDASNANSITEAGAVYVFERDLNGSWLEIQKLVASDRHDFDDFGNSIAISNDYIVVGCKANDYDIAGNNFMFASGAIYIFERDTNGVFNEVQKIISSNRQPGDFFGQSVAIENNTIMVSSIGDDEDVSGANAIGNAGAVYIFNRDTNGVWQETQKIVSSGRSALDKFGNSIDINGNYLIVGVEEDDDDLQEQNPLTDAGSAYIFEKDNSGAWLELQKLVATDRATEDEFANSVAIDGDYAVIGSHFQDLDNQSNTPLTDAGASYVFKRDIATNGWTQIQKLTASNRDAGDDYGVDVAIKGDYIMIGARNETEPNFGGGAVYTYKKEMSGNWNEEQILRQDPNLSSGLNYGESIAVNENYMIASTPIKIINGMANAGASNVYELDSNLSITDYSFNTISIYPNPTKNSLNIELNSVVDFFTVQVINSLGQLILKQEYKNTNQALINMANNNTGLYFVQVTMLNGASKVLKVIKQ